ncbi:UDP-glucose 4-epimerase [Aix galericulata]|nr:UDP-glucose 4-epimerase [Aix galericulata]
MAEPVLVTGGAGYIGSHCVLQLVQAGYEPVVVDNLHNASPGPDALPESLRRVQLLARRPIAFHQLDVTDGAALQELFSQVGPGHGGLRGARGAAGTKRPPGAAGGGSRGGTGWPLPGWGLCPFGADPSLRPAALGPQWDPPGGCPTALRRCLPPPQHRFSAVVHFAGLKAVGESVQQPLEYYRVNLTGTIRLLEVRQRHVAGLGVEPAASAAAGALPQAMKAHGVKNIVFSSSATVYGDPKYLPLDENHPVGSCTNPYGKSKYFIEEMIRDLCKADKDWNAVLLRYFNPIGAHESGMIGEDPQGIPNNLMPYVAQVAVGRREFLSVFGNDYETIDGTGVRDYIHVVDLARGHIAALKKLKENCGCKVYNLGTGTGYSVLQMVRAMEKASGREIKYKITGRREGDVASCYANPELAERELGWKAAFGLDKMCEDLWRWQRQNPTGFSKN